MELLDRFIRAFTRGIHEEMQALRETFGTFEIDVTAVAGPKPKAGCREYVAHRSRDKLYTGLEGTLRWSEGECLVRVIDCTQGGAVLQRVEATVGTTTAPETIRASTTDLPETATLVVYPWFLYESLLASIESIGEDSTCNATMALSVFGKAAVREYPALDTPQRALNNSQHAAVAYALSHSVTVIWGPPGTGKTHTTADLVSRLLEQGERVLVTSTTNAAIDQLTRAAVGNDAVDEMVGQGRVLRFGGAADQDDLGESKVVARLSADIEELLRTLRAEAHDLRDRMARAEELLGRTVPDDSQLDLFQSPSADIFTPAELLAVLSATEASRFDSGSITEQRERIQEEIESIAAALSEIEAQEEDAIQRRTAVANGALQNARLVFSTLSQLSVRASLAEQRFDSVVVDESAMAILPAIFVAAARAGKRCILVGDPKQLPPIVTARSEFVSQTVRRSIFDVCTSAGIPVHLLNEQYRMHPRIGTLVGEVFYEGRLQNHPTTSSRTAITALAPYPGRSIIAVSTSGSRCCRSTDSRSRYNDWSADRAAALAAEATASGLRDTAIVSPYAEQSRRISTILSSLGLHDIGCATVHRFQGNERDCIIFDAVDTEPMAPGILTTGSETAAHLINVMASRARGKLILLVDEAYILHRAPRSPLATILKRIAGQRL